MHRPLIAALTVLVFGAGYAARVWVERDRPVPPPPEALGSEFAHPPASRPATDKESKRKPGVNRASLIADIQKARPGIEAYRKRMEELDAQFDQGLVALLSPEQREKFIARQKRNEKRRTEQEARDAANTAPLSDEEILRLQQIPLFNVLWTITISARLERLHRDLKLDDAQQARVRELLLARREQFLALVDSAPPPTVSLSLLATRAQKLGDPATGK